MTPFLISSPIMKNRDLRLSSILLFVLLIAAYCNAAVIFTDGTEGPVAFGVAEIRQALGDAATIKPCRDMAASSETVQIIVTLLDNTSLKAQLKKEGGTLPENPKQEGYSLRVTRTNGITRYWVLGTDETGAMYGAFDIAEAITQERLATLSPGDHSPAIRERGIKFNIPLDARTPSYSDAADNAWNNVETVWDFEFWRAYLDQLARDRYNVLTLWNEHPFPSLVKVPEYPNIALSDIKKNSVDFDCGMDGTNMLPDKVVKNLVTIQTMSIDQKIAFWRKVMQYGRDRGIRFYIVTWNVFTYGTFGQYGITDDMANETTKDYLRKSVRSLILTYPLLAGIGTTAGENMRNDFKKSSRNDVEREVWLWQTYGLGLKDAKQADPARHIRFIHRVWQSGIPVINKAFAEYPDPIDYEYKYSIAHMFSSVKPNFADETVAAIPAGKQIWFTLRNDDFFMTRWGDSAYARDYIKNMPGGDKLAGFMMGSSGYVWGREWMSTEPEHPRQQTLDKHWYYFMLFGRLAYDPDTPDDTFRGMMKRKFPGVNASELFDGWASVSKIIPLVNQFHWQGADFQWYPEACLSAPGRKDSYGYHNVRTFIKVSPQPGVAIIGIPAYVEQLQSGVSITGTTPLSVAGSLKTYADEALQKIRDIAPGNDKELRLTLGDIKAVAHLGYYYSEKILGATELALFEKTGKVEHQKSAIEHLQNAASYWQAYANLISSQYTPWKSARIGMIDVQALYKDALHDIVLAGGADSTTSDQPTAEQKTAY